MKTAHVLVLLFAALLALGALLGRGLLDPGGSPVGPAKAEGPAAELDLPAREARPELVASETPEAGARRATPGPGERRPGPDERILRGRVRVPSGVSDPDLRVYALRLPARYQELAAALDHPGDPLEPADRTRLLERVRAAMVSQTAVGPEGRFELPFPSREHVAHLAVRGRYLHLPETTPYPTRSEEPALLSPAAGAWIHGRVTDPAGEGLAGARVRVFGFTSGGTMGLPGRPGTFTGLVASDADGTYQVRAVPIRGRYQWTARSETLGGRRGVFSTLEPGAELIHDVVLDGECRVRGRVVDENGRPVPHATVSAWLPGIAFGLDDELTRRVSADGEGRYDLFGLPEGDVKVSADHPERLDSPRKRLTLEEDEVRDEVDLVLRPGRAIAGRVLGPDGVPATDVDVRASFDMTRTAGPDFLNATRGARAAARTDGGGHFTLRGLGAGPFVVEAETAGADGLPARARRGGVLPGGPPLELTLRTPLHLAGRVVDEQGRPVSVFSVVARQEVMGEFLSVTVAYRRGSFADEEGRFVLEGLTAGTWEVTVEGEGLVSPGPVPVELPSEEATSLRLPTVRAAAVSGVVRAAGRAPVPGARVHLSARTAGWQVQDDPFPDERRTTTDEAGRFLLDGLVPGKLALVAEAEGHGPSTTLDLELQPGELREDASIVLTRGGTLVGEAYDREGEPARRYLVLAFQMPEFSQIMGGTDGEGRFRIEHVPPGSYMVLAMDPRAEIEVTEEGLDMGSMFHQFQMAQAAVKEGETTHVVIGERPDRPVHLTGEVTLGGEPFGGVLLSFVRPGAQMYENMRTARVAEDGTYEVELDGGGAYVVTVQSVTGAGGKQSSIEYSIEIPEDVEEATRDFRLPLGRISGRLDGPEGAPAAGARVTLTFDGLARSDSYFGGQYTEITTEADGTFDIRALRRGTYRLSAGGASPISGAAQTPYGRVTTGDLELDEDEWLSGVNLRLPRPGTIDVTVLDPAIQPVPKASVFVRDAEGRMLEPFSMVVTDGAGRCEYGGVAPGTVTVSARSGLLTCEESARVDVPEGGRVAVTLRLEPGTILRVVLRDEQGRPASAAVSVVDEAGREMTGMFGMTDLQALYMEGEYSPHERRLGPLPPGRYTVSAVLGGREVSRKVRLHGQPEKRVVLRAR